jgi:hypothetical protein
MSRFLLAAAAVTALSMAVPAAAQSQPELSELKAQVEELIRKIAEMEASQARIAEIEAKQAKSGWTEKISITSDLRLRFEGIDLEGFDQQDRQRLRARLMLKGRVNDKSDINLMLSTGGSNPRSQDFTFDGDASAEEITVRQAYVSWRPTDLIDVTAGKVRQPWALNPVDYFYDSDYMPEGLAVNFGASAGFFGSVHWFQLDERGGDDDTSVLGAQAGYAGDLFYANVSYQDFRKIQGFNPCYIGICNGNTVDANGNLVYDYDIVQLRGGVKLSGFDIFASWARNADADIEDTAYSYGVSYGKVKDPGTWSVGALYQDMEKDALYGGMIDATFAGGRTAHDGFAIKGAYGLAKNWSASLIFFSNSIGKTGNERDYDRYQLDFIWKL